MTLFEDIVSTVQRFHNNLMTEAELRNYFGTLNRDDCNVVNIRDGFTEFLFSWREKNQHTVPLHVVQPDEDDTCWAIALSRGQNALVAINQSLLALLTLDALLEGVDCLRSQSRSVNRLEDLVSFMEDTGFVKKMVVHHRPRGSNQREQDRFERLIENLLAKGPVVVCFDVFPSYDDFLGDGVYSPTDDECEMRLNQRFGRHCVVLYGKGVRVEGQRIKEFWEALESRGFGFGDAGFVRLARGRLLIREVVEMKV